MATVHTELPSGDGHEGEKRFAQALSAVPDDRTHLWFGVDHLPGVADIDVMIAIPGVGAFVIEVKAVTLDAIDEYGAGVCQIRNRPGTKTPLKQARTAQIQLSQYLRDVAGIKHPPFLFVTAAWPRITRADFLARWRGPAVAAQAEGMIFADDVESVAALISVLQRAIQRPPLGGAPARRPDLSAKDVEAIEAAVSPRAAVEPTLVDVERMKVIKTSTQDRRRRYLEPGEPKEVLFRGRPGTGKTFRLLEIAVSHARAGRSVLLACYNMVLAAELRRMLLLDPNIRGANSTIDIVDVFQLLRRYPWDESDFDRGSYNVAATNMVERLKSTTSPAETYGTILVDEAQDLEPWMYGLLRWHAEPQCEWFVAEGSGQALYRDAPARWLTEYKERAKASKTTENLRRVFRTAKADFYIAQGTYEQSPNLAGIDDWLAAHPFHRPDPDPQTVSDSQLALELGELVLSDEDFDRLGSAPTLSNMPVFAETLSDAEYRDGVVKAYAALIEEELALLKRIGSPGDLAILVPRTNKWSAMGERVCDALRSTGVGFLDQVDDSRAKRRPLPADTVRVVTYHSARGVEASRVMLVGLEELGRKVGGQEQRIKNLAYVALSRAKHGTRIVVPAERTGPHLDFVRALVGRLTSEIEAAPAPPVGAESPHQAQASGGTEWIAGEVARFVSERGFGFLSGPHGEHFFHINSLFEIDANEIEAGQPVLYAIEADADIPRATFVCHAIPPGLADPPEDSMVGALVTEPIGDRGFGFLLAPSVSGRIFFHHSSVDGDKSHRPERGDRVDVTITTGSDGRPRAKSVRMR